MGILELLSRGRIVELNKVLEPGKEGRRLEIRRFKIFAGEFMHDIDTMSHIGTHAEAPSHFIPALYEGKEAPDISEFPADSWWEFGNIRRLFALIKGGNKMRRSLGMGSDVRHGVDIVHELARKYFKPANFQPPALLPRF